jgi:hypothetical protein
MEAFGKLSQPKEKQRNESEAANTAGRLPTGEIGSSDTNRVDNG